MSAPPPAPDAGVLLRAAWVCPITASPRHDGWVHVVDGRITAVGAGHDTPPAGRVLDLGPVALFGARSAVSLALAVASYHLVEQPVRRAKVDRNSGSASGGSLGSGLQNT